MDMTETAQDAAFRTEVRHFLASHLPPDIRDAVRDAREVGRDAVQRWQRILHAQGWLAPAWPVERLGLSRVGESKKRLQRLKQIAAEDGQGGPRLIEQDWFRRKLVHLEVRLRALEVTVLRFVADADSACPAGADASMLKLRGSKLLQDVLQASVEALGHRGLVLEAPPDPAVNALEAYGGLPSARFQSRAYTIAGGSSEVQRNILAKQVLGLLERSA